MTDHYKTLGVDRSATPAEIKSAFRKLAFVHHPDRNGGCKKAEEKFKSISEAYDVLSNTSTRDSYNRGGETYSRPYSSQVRDDHYPIHMTVSQMCDPGFRYRAGFYSIPLGGYRHGDSVRSPELPGVVFHIWALDVDEQFRIEKTTGNIRTSIKIKSKAAKKKKIISVPHPSGKDVRIVLPHNLKPNTKTKITASGKGLPKSQGRPATDLIIMVEVEQRRAVRVVKRAVDILTSFHALILIATFVAIANEHPLTPYFVGVSIVVIILNFVEWLSK